MPDTAERASGSTDDREPAGTYTFRRFLPLIGLAVILRSLAAIFAKQAALVSVGHGVAGLLINIWLVAEVVVLGLQAITSSTILRRVPLTYAYPYLGLVFAINLGAARFVFGETVQLQHMVGVGIIILGVLLMSTETREIVPSRH